MNAITIQVLAPAMQRAAFETLLRGLSGVRVVSEGAPVVLVAGRDWPDRLDAAQPDPAARPALVLVAEEGALDLLLGARAGVRVFLAAEDPGCLRLAIEAAARGECYYSPTLHPVIHAAIGGPAPTGAASRLSLTESERVVLEIVLLGHTNREIAAQLHVSVPAVKFHVRNVLKKTGARSRYDLPVVVHRFRLGRQQSAG